MGKKSDNKKYVTMDVDALREQFDSFDKDGSGFLEAGEAVAALTAIGSKLSFADLDTDGDNKISFEEFSVFSQLVGKHTHPIFKKVGHHARLSYFSCDDSCTLTHTSAVRSHHPAALRSVCRLPSVPRRPPRILATPHRRPASPSLPAMPT